jgi:multidrug efflux pump
VRIGGGQRYAMRIWLDRQAMAARDITVADVEGRPARRKPGAAGGQHRIPPAAVHRAHPARLSHGRGFRTAGPGPGPEDGYLVRLGDIARVERGTEENRTFFRGNGVAMVGIGIIKQSTANTIEVAGPPRRKCNASPRFCLPVGQIKQSYDTSVFVEGAINEVYKTLAIAIGLVILVIYLFLGSVRATLVPAVTVPVSIVASFIVLYALDFSVNLLTLLALGAGHRAGGGRCHRGTGKHLPAHGRTMGNPRWWPLTEAPARWALRSLPRLWC